MEPILSVVTRKLKEAFTGGHDRNTDKDRGDAIERLTNYIKELEGRIQKLENQDG